MSDDSDGPFNGQTGEAHFELKGTTKTHYSDWEIGSQTLRDGFPVIRADFTNGAITMTLTFDRGQAEEFLEAFRDAIDEVRLTELKQDCCVETENTTENEETGDA